MNSMHYVGLDVHKKTVAYCVKKKDGEVVDSGSIRATRRDLGEWARLVEYRWAGAMEATLFTGWIYDFLKPYAVELTVAHPKMLKAIWAGKRKNDKLDAEKLADLLRCDLLPKCHMSSKKIRDLRRVLRYRNLMVRMAVRMKNKTSGLLMEVGAEYNKKRLHAKRYFHELLDNLEDVPPSVIELLRLTRSGMEVFDGCQRKLLSALTKHKDLRQRVELLRTIPAVGEVTALTWALEIGDPHRFSTVNRAVSYCGLCSAQRESAGKNTRGPISKDRNKHLQTILIEAAKLAPNWNPELAALHEKETQKGNRNRATLAVARKLVALLLAVDKRGTPYEPKGNRGTDPRVCTPILNHHGSVPSFPECEARRKDEVTHITTPPTKAKAKK
ncbi:IS110 family transposase, partial [Candidatus Hydrogenedentota bacterium]